MKQNEPGKTKRYIMTILKRDNNPEPQIFSHRGRCFSKFPNAKDNSLQSFANIFFQGINRIETDLWMTKDRVMVINHDPKLRFSSPGNITKSTYKRLKYCNKGLKPGSHKYFWSKKLNLAMLETIFDKFPSFVINLELKSLTNRGITEFEKDWLKELSAFITIGKYGEKLILSSFNWDLIDYIAQFLPNVRRGYLFDNKKLWRDALNRGKVNNIYSLHPHFSIIDENLFNKGKELGYDFFVWTVDKKEDIIRMIQMNIDGIITDYPLLAKKIISDYNESLVTE